MGGPDEFATVADLEAVYRVIALAAFDCLCQRRAGAQSPTFATSLSLRHEASCSRTVAEVPA
ncbi:MAG: hypothetical protein O6766_02260, partial [Gammaproteobacteria bacterium]|nr:hypothetical protein [Gammaproteobacteria bacterium]